MAHGPLVLLQMHFSFIDKTQFRRATLFCDSSYTYWCNLLVAGYYIFIRRICYYCVLRVFYNICSEPQQNLGRGLLQRKTGLSSPVIYY